MKIKINGFEIEGPIEVIREILNVETAGKAVVISSNSNPNTISSASYLYGSKS